MENREEELIKISNKVLEIIDGLRFSEKQGILNYVDFEIKENLRRQIKNGK